MANPPTEVSRASYGKWLNDIGSESSQFLDLTFDWYETQLKSALPGQVQSDPQKLYVDVQHAKQQTIALETSGDIPSFTTVGFDAYGLVQSPIAVTLEASLYYLGKPVGLPQGATFPVIRPFGCSRCAIEEKWGTGNYFSTMTHIRGGLARDLNDGHTNLVRGNASDGYTIFGNFFGPISGKSTATTAQISILMIKPSSDGWTEFRQSMRRNGQSYLSEGNRMKYGFNEQDDRQNEKAIANVIKELNETGKIKETPC